jgi:hypothetical protein
VGFKALSNVAILKNLDKSPMEKPGVRGWTPALQVEERTVGTRKDPSDRGRMAFCEAQ